MNLMRHIESARRWNGFGATHILVFCFYVGCEMDGAVLPWKSYGSKANNCMRELQCYLDILANYFPGSGSIV